MLNNCSLKRCLCSALSLVSSGSAASASFLCSDARSLVKSDSMRICSTASMGRFSRAARSAITRSARVFPMSTNAFSKSDQLFFCSGWRRRVALMRAVREMNSFASCLASSVRSVASRAASGSVNAACVKRNTADKNNGVLMVFQKPGELAKIPVDLCVKSKRLRRPRITSLGCTLPTKPAASTVPATAKQQQHDNDNQQSGSIH